MENELPKLFGKNGVRDAVVKSKRGRVMGDGRWPMPDKSGRPLGESQ
jgi:hypothetical protein